VEKRVKEHHRRLKKETNRARKKGLAPSTVKRKPKDPGIPNDWPHKEELLKQLEKAKADMARRTEQRKEDAAAKRKDQRANILANRRGLVVPGTSLPGLAEAAADRAEAYMAAANGEAEDDIDHDGSLQKAKQKANGQQSRRAYLRELRKVVESADVIIEVLDARDPMGSRALAVEATVSANPNKRLILVLNKVDLVPRDVTRGWLAVLRRAHPTVAFKASTKEKAGRGAAVDSGIAAEDASDQVLQRGGAVGGEALLNVLKNYARSGDMKTSIAVGVIGYPNTGKSSLINSLKCESVVSTSSVAGHTKSMQEVKLDKNIRLLDSPGIVFDDADGEATVLRNCVNPDDIEDPEGVIAAMLRRCGPEQLMKVYSLPAFGQNDADTFLSFVSRRLGKMKRGGIPDKAAAARAVLNDWNSGRVPYYTAPPKDTAHLVSSSASIVSSFGKAFDVEKMDAAVLEELENDGDSMIDAVSFEASLSEAATKEDGAFAVASSMEASDEDEEITDQDSEGGGSKGAHTEKKSNCSKNSKVQIEPIDELGFATGGIDSRRQQKTLLKKRKKQERRGNASKMTED
jgi:nuclear GTP-binding protein